MQLHTEHHALNCSPPSSAATQTLDDCESDGDDDDDDDATQVELNLLNNYMNN